MTQHIRGPWRVQYQDRRMILKHKASGAVLATETNISQEMAEFIKEVANLSHERSGAPDLLDALEAIVADARNGQCEIDVIGIADAAIAKARGQS